MATQPLPGDRPNPWSNSVVGDFPPEVHEAHTAKKGVHSFAEYGISTSKATKILSKAAAHVADDQIATVALQKQKARSTGKPAAKPVQVKGGKK